MTGLLPADDHVHSEWSWDALAGSMAATCARAVEVGLPALAFTEHADFTPWTLPPDADLPAEWRQLVTGNVLTPPELDLDGYLACLDQCRDRFPGLRILSGVELSEPHWHHHRAAELLDLGRFDRVLSSVHSLATDGSAAEASDAYLTREPAGVIREYLAETLRMVQQFDAFEVLAHIDYPLRYWPSDVMPFVPGVFEDEYRVVLRELARNGKVLELNTRVPMPRQILRWWYEEGGQRITFASDAHDPDSLARGFADAAAMAAACGFRSGRRPYDQWRRD